MKDKDPTKNVDLGAYLAQLVGPNPRPIYSASKEGEASHCSLCFERVQKLNQAIEEEFAKQPSVMSMEWLKHVASEAAKIDESNVMASRPKKD